jgi:hypothetical protein
MRLSRFRERAGPPMGLAGAGPGARGEGEQVQDIMPGVECQATK